MRQRPPARVKAFVKSRGTMTRTNRVDAELIARCLAFRLEVSRLLPSASTGFAPSRARCFDSQNQ